MQATLSLRVPENRQRPTFERMMRPGDRHPVGKVLQVGSVWRFPSIVSIMTS